MQRRRSRYQLCTPQLFSGGSRLRSGSQATDGDIVRAVLAGDRERYAQLVERYRDRYARYATRMLGSVDAAEDAVQDAFVRAYDQLAQCKEPDKFVVWFFLILRNRCFAEGRRNRRTASRATARAARAHAGSARGVRPEACRRVVVQRNRGAAEYFGAVTENANASRV